MPGIAESTSRWKALQANLLVPPDCIIASTVFRLNKIRQLVLPCSLLRGRFSLKILERVSSF